MFTLSNGEMDTYSSISGVFNCSTSQSCGRIARVPLNNSSRVSFRAALGITHTQNRPLHEIYESLCTAFSKKVCSLNSPHYKLNQAEFKKVLRSLAEFKKTLSACQSESWSLECGESSKSSSAEDPITWHIVCHILDNKCKVVGKFEVTNLERRFILSQPLVSDRNTSLLESMQDLSSATIKDRHYNIDLHV